MVRWNKQCIKTDSRVLTIVLETVLRLHGVRRNTPVVHERGKVRQPFFRFLPGSDLTCLTCDICIRYTFVHLYNCTFVQLLYIENTGISDLFIYPLINYQDVVNLRRSSISPTFSRVAPESLSIGPGSGEHLVKNITVRGLFCPHGRLTP